jgi:hypothetical protein
MGITTVMITITIMGITMVTDTVMGITMAAITMTDMADITDMITTRTVSTRMADPEPAVIPERILAVATMTITTEAEAERMAADIMTTTITIIVTNGTT